MEFGSVSQDTNIVDELNALDVKAERYLLSGEEKSEIEKTTL